MNYFKFFKESFVIYIALHASGSIAVQVGNIAEYISLRSVSILYSSNALSYQISNIPGWSGRYFTPNGNRGIVMCNQILGKNDLLKWVNTDVANSITGLYSIIPPNQAAQQWHNRGLFRDVKGNVIQTAYGSVELNGDGSFRTDSQGRPIAQPPMGTCAHYAQLNSITPTNIPIGICHGDITAMGYLPGGAGYPNPMLRLVPKDLYDINIGRMASAGNGQILFTPNPAQNCGDPNNALSQHPTFSVSLQNNQVIISLQACQSALNAVATINLVQLQAYLSNPPKSDLVFPIVKNTDEYIHIELNFTIDATSFQIADVSIAAYRGNSYSSNQRHIRTIDVFSKQKLLDQGILSLMQ
jgi:hypothetical protein